MQARHTTNFLSPSILLCLPQDSSEYICTEKKEECESKIYSQISFRFQKTYYYYLCVCYLPAVCVRTISSSKTHSFLCLMLSQMLLLLLLLTSSPSKHPSPAHSIYSRCYCCMCSHLATCIHHNSTVGVS